MSEHTWFQENLAGYCAGGLSIEETAEVLKISPVTVKREWRAARTWLYRELRGAVADEP